MKTTWKRLGLTRKRDSRFLLLGILIFFLSGASYSEKKAFVLGLNTYDNLPAERQLHKALNDAVSIGQSLEKLGFLVKVEKNLTFLEFVESWEEFLENITSGDEVVFFFSGHGIEIEGENFLLTRDSPYVQYDRTRKLKRRSLNLTELLLDIEGKKPRINLAVIDACRENPFVPQEYKGIVGNNGGLLRTDPPLGSMVMYSAAAKQIALESYPGNDDKNPNSVYVRHLIPLLDKPNQKIQSVARVVMSQVTQATKKFGHMQRPSYYDSILGPYCLSGEACKPDFEITQAMVESFIAETEKSLTTNVGPELTVSEDWISGWAGSTVPINDSVYQLSKPLEFKDATGFNWVTPAGTVVDTSAIPRAYWSVFGSPAETPELFGPVAMYSYYANSKEKSFVDTSQMFYEYMLSSGVTKPKADVVYGAVNLSNEKWE